MQCATTSPTFWMMPKTKAQICNNKAEFGMETQY